MLVSEARVAIAIERERRRRRQALTLWPAAFTNSDTGHTYSPHTAGEQDAVFGHSPRYILIKGGEGSGKSVGGIIWILLGARLGFNQIMVSPDLEHFKRSLWPEFRRWCPPEVVVPEHRYRLSKTWEPRQPFQFSFLAEHGGISTILCGGIDDPIAWEGGNVTRALLDEARRKKDAAALKVLDGRIRIAGPKGEQPQLMLTTTPAKHWLFDYFGPPLEGKPDPYLGFKQDAKVVTLRVADNASHLSEGYVERRRQSLSEAEARVLMDAEWADVDDNTRFLPTMQWWDACEDGTLPPLDNHTPLVIALDAAVSGDSFAMVAVSRLRDAADSVALCYARAWTPQGGKIDFAPIEDELRLLCQQYNVVCVCYDPYQLHSTASRLEQDGVAWFKEFPQGNERLLADRQLLALITERRLAHRGESGMREHVDNANRKTEGDSKLRIVKRTPSLKIDLVVALSMAAATCLELNL